MSTAPKGQPDLRISTASKLSAPRAVADGLGGKIIAIAEVGGPPERVFRALTEPAQLERWWRHPDYYSTSGWKVNLRVCADWSVTVRFPDGSTNVGSGEFAELDPPRKIAMTRKFARHPLQGTRETTITYCLEPAANGTRVTLRDEGFVGRAEAAYGKAEHWERVLCWLAAYFNQDTEGDNK